MKPPFAENEIVRGIEACTWVVMCALAACAAPAVPAPRPVARETPDQAALRVISYSRRSGRIVRPWSAVTDTPLAGEGVPLVLAGSPGVELVLDRDYWALVVTGTGWPTVSWVLGSKDEQSGLEIVVADPMPLDALLGGDRPARPTRGPGTYWRAGTVGGVAIEWRRRSDYGELYSDCAVTLAGHQLTLTVTAKTEARRQALEDRLASLQLSYSAPPSSGGPKN
jgi:hypothetical protein